MLLFEGWASKFRFVYVAVLIAAGGLLLTPGDSLQAGTSGHYVDEKFFFKKAKKLMHRRGMGDLQFQTYKQIINYWNDNTKISDPRWLAYVMATAYHETQLKPVREGFKKTDAAARKHVRWMWNKRIITLPYHRPDRVTGHVYYGRGYVQLTWAENYKKMGRAIGMGDELYRNPDLVLKPEIASKILFVGMIKGKFRYSKRRKPRGKQRLKLFFNNRSGNWYGARNIINGDLRKNGNRVAGYGRKYAKSIKFTSQPVIPDDATPATPGEGEVKPDLPGTNVADADTPGQQGGGAGDTPSTGETPAGGETPATDGTPSTGETPAGGETPATGGTPSTGETPTGGETPATGGTPSTGETPSTGDTPPVIDAGGEVVPVLPGEEELVPDEPTDVTPNIPAGPPVSGGGDVDVEIDVDKEVVPIPVDHPVLIDTSGGGGPTGPSGTGTPSGSADSNAGGAGTGTQPPVTPPTPPKTVEKTGWWNSVKSFFAKYSGYVWKY